jgi:hypothetical protein
MTYPFHQGAVFGKGIDFGRRPHQIRRIWPRQENTLAADDKDLVCLEFRCNSANGSLQIFKSAGWTGPRHQFAVGPLLCLFLLARATILFAALRIRRLNV